MKFLKVKHLIKPKHRMNMDIAPTLLLELVFERTGALNKGGHVGSVDGTRYHCYNQRTSKSILHRVFTTPRADVAVESSPTICDAIANAAVAWRSDKRSNRPSRFGDCDSNCRILTGGAAAAKAATAAAKKKLLHVRLMYVHMCPCFHSAINRIVSQQQQPQHSYISSSSSSMRHTSSTTVSVQAIY